MMVMLEDMATEQNWVQPVNQTWEAPALMIYTSGTTGKWGGLVIYHQASRRSFFLGKPKGVLLSHANLMAQMEAMEEAWAWTCDDLIYHPLPLHHIHVREISVMLILLPLGNC